MVDSSRPIPAGKPRAARTEIDLDQATMPSIPRAGAGELREAFKATVDKASVGRTQAHHSERENEVDEKSQLNRERVLAMAANTLNELRKRGVVVGGSARGDDEGLTSESLNRLNPNIQKTLAV